MTDKTKAIVKAGSPVQAIVPTTVDEAYRLAQSIGGTDMVPQIGPKNDRRPMSHQEVMAVFLVGMEVGLKPMVSLRSIAFFNGRPAFWGDGQLALIQSRDDYGGMQEHFDEESQTATCEITRIIDGQPQTISRSFSMKQADHAKLTNKFGPWKDYPERMLQHRARGWALRDAFSDALMGIVSEAEARDMPEDIELIEGDIVEDLPDDPTPYEEVKHDKTEPSTAHGTGDGPPAKAEKEKAADSESGSPQDIEGIPIDVDDLNAKPDETGGASEDVRSKPEAASDGVVEDVGTDRQDEHSEEVGEPEESPPDDPNPDEPSDKVEQTPTLEACSTVKSLLSATTSSKEALEVFNKGGGKEAGLAVGPRTTTLIKALVATYRDVNGDKMADDEFAKRVNGLMELAGTIDEDFGEVELNKKIGELGIGI